MEYPDNPLNTPERLEANRKNGARNPRCLDCGEIYPPDGGGHHRARYGGCCQTFTSDEAFDAHRVGSHSDRTCLPVDQTEGWRHTPFGWTNSKPMTEEEKARIAGR